MKPVFNFSEPVNYVWKDIPLTVSKAELQNVDLSTHYSLESALAHFSSGLSFLEKFEVLRFLESYAAINIKKFFDSFDQHFDENLYKKINEKFSQWPQSFIEWAKKKDLNPKDFRVFLMEDCTPVLDIIGNLNPSKMNGLQIIDMSLDLLACEKVKLEKLQSFKSDQSLLKFLKKTRFSKTFDQDEELSRRLSKIEMAQGVSLKSLRLGDQNQLVLEIKSTTPEELIKKIERVQKKVSVISDAWAGERA